MEYDSQLGKKIKAGDFIITAEYLPKASADIATVEKVQNHFKAGLTAVNVADNPHGPVMSSLAGSLALNRSGIEPIYQIVTRDRNRIAIQSDVLGAVSLSIRNILCLSGYHQALTTCPQSANVYDLDSIQLIYSLKEMNKKGRLIDGSAIEGDFSVLIGAVANPDLKPMELNIVRLSKKIMAGASFIQTQAIFDIDAFGQWIDMAEKNGITSNAAIIAGVMPISSAAEAELLGDKYTDFTALTKIIKRLKQAGDEDAQKKEGLSICTEIIKKIKEIKGIRGIHIISGGKEELVPEVINAAGLSLKR